MENEPLIPNQTLYRGTQGPSHLSPIFLPRSSLLPSRTSSPAEQTVHCLDSRSCCHLPQAPVRPHCVLEGPLSPPPLGSLGDLPGESPPPSSFLGAVAPRLQSVRVGVLGVAVCHSSFQLRRAALGQGQVCIHLCISRTKRAACPRAIS